jgi:aspartate kinase
VKVAKFGGSSVANAERIKHVADIVLGDPQRRFIVLSAPGKADKNETKITDLLIQAARDALGGALPSAALDTVKRRYSDICRQLGLPAAVGQELIQALDKAVTTSTDHADAFRDAVVCMGEDLMARLFAAYLGTVRKVPAHYVAPEEAELIVSAEFSNAFPLPGTPPRFKAKLADRPGITVFPGFFGVTSDGRRATFSRGGSDLTGALVAEAVDADVYENWTDVDGIFRVDPSIVPNPELIHEVTYREIRELAYIGFKVIHHDAIMPARRRRIPVNLRNTNNLAVPGTMIVDSRIPLADVVVGIAMKKDFCCFTIEKYFMNREIGFGRRLLSIIEEAGLSYEHMPSGIDSVSVYLDQNQLREEMTSEIVRRMYRDLGADKVDVENDKAMVIAVGEGMKRHVGVASRLVAALARQKINIEMINQGASELSVIFGIRSEDGEAAVRAMYDEFFGPERPNGTPGTKTVAPRKPRDEAA